MSSFVFMKLLENRAGRYDTGMRLLTLGTITERHRAVAETVPDGSSVLEIGCGTGGVTSLLLARGCTVTGIDNAEPMLAVARDKLAASLDSGALTLHRGSVTQLSRFCQPESVDVVLCCLVFSELSQTERDHALREFATVLRPGGTVVIADEVVPDSLPARLAYWTARAPLAAVTYLATQTTTRPVTGIDAAMRSHGLSDVATTTHGRSFQIATGRRPAWQPARPH